MGQLEQDASYILRSPHRTKVIQKLAEGPAIPAQIKEDTNQEYSRISEALSTLENQDLVELLVDEDTERGRMYEITERGKHAHDYLKENDMI